MKLEKTYRTTFVPTKTLRASAHQFTGQCFKVYDKRHNYFKVEYRFQTAYFEIRDTGCGIAEADLERIFNPFERGSNVVQGGFTGIDSTTHCKIVGRFTRWLAICDQSAQSGFTI